MQTVMSNEGSTFMNGVEDEIQYIWRRNCPYLYDTMLSYTLEWPTLTIDWLPNSYKSVDGSYSVHKIIYGTHTSDQEPNYLIIAEVHISDLEENEDLMNVESFAEYSYNPDNTNMNTVQFEVKAKLNHPEEVNKALHMPEHPFVIASRVVNGDILVFDYSKHESFPTDDLVHPQLLLKGHSKEGYAMDWGNGVSNNYLISGGSDNIINLWDFNNNTYGILNSSARNHFNYPNKINVDSQESYELSPPILKPIKSISWHNSVVNDLKWHPSDPSIFGSVSDDGTFSIWDLRSLSENSPNLFRKTESGINTLSFNQFVPTMVSTGNLDGIVQIWDIRNTKEELFSLNFHSEKPIICMEWSKWSPNILITGGVDNKVIVWDLYKNHSYKENDTSYSCNNDENINNNNQINEDHIKAHSQQDSSDPNAVFIHYGHTAPITSISWNPNEHGDPLLIASASEDNTIQFWQFSDTFLN
ncbi:uncharacterized protein cubi_01765 [Cryptosporidium ubiquitum]|uniref:Histone-binding protein RBBP4-like N-terminal domain-containing protein n=1 Tax=Cryptosporidium ubiquitum TaxID=857276 RepID=A0A1J4MAN5_9CRYT|nr:uncharacterized protein cubi_01765 [Cryptosporidium ubiquitum]OII71290.1 hypothetical protein cubi_01765 [Cryptosporidium ubiquitum]